MITDPAMEMDTRKIKFLGFWNVRTMLETSKANQIAKEMETYRISILGLSETRWNGCGKTTLQSGTTVIYSGKKEEDKHEHGVAFMLNREATKSLIEWEGISERIIVARLKARFHNISVINAYAPTNTANSEEKEEFYEELQTVFDRVQDVHRRDIVILMGDMNSKIGRDNTNRETVMGTQGIGEMNENGEMFTNFCAHNELVIGGSMFQHKDIHKVTWISPDGKVKNQIDHIAIKRKWKHSLLDVRAMRGADVYTDHNLMRAKLQIKLVRNMEYKQGYRERYNVQWLREDGTIATKYTTELRKKLGQMESNQENSIEDIWKKCKEIFKDTAKQTIGIQQVKQKLWISKSTWDKIEERKQIKKEILAMTDITKKMEAENRYKDKDREVKRSARRDKRKYQEDILKEGEEAAKKHDLKSLYDATRKLSGKRNNNVTQIRNKEGKIIKNEKQVMNRWIEYFEEIYSKQDPMQEEEIDQMEKQPTLDIETANFTKEEIQKAIQQLKNGKAMGIDGIPAELLKADSETSTEILIGLINKIWNEEKLPEEWQQGIIVKIPKKGDHTKCENWRAITLLSVISKVMARIILERIKTKIETRLRQNQAGFRTRRSCTDHIATLRIIIEQALEWQNKMYLNFIDFEKAFDRVNREKMWLILENYGIPEKYINIIKLFYKNYTAQVLHNGTLTRKFEIQTGVRQGCVLSPTIFIILMDWVMTRAVRNKTGIRWNVFHQLEDLEFADDVCLLSEKRQHMQKKTEKIAKEAKKLGLKINVKKTKIMKINTPREMGIYINEKEIESVEKMNYLGSILNNKGDIEEDIVNRINKAQTAYHMLKNVWRSKELTTQTKLRIFDTNVKSVLLYGSETWKTTKRNTDKIQVFINKCLRKMLGIYWPNRITNRELWRKTNQEPINKTIKRRKWKWIGHTLRREDDIAKQALEYKPTGSRKIGRPTETWKRSIDKELEEANMKWTEVKVEARNRENWKRIVEALCSERSEED